MLRYFYTQLSLRQACPAASDALTTRFFYQRRRSDSSVYPQFPWYYMANGNLFFIAIT